MLKKSIVTGTASVAFASFIGAGALPAQAGNALLPSDGFYADVRIRHEGVDQDGISKDANANTIRTKFGYKSGTVDGFQFLIEGEDVASIGSSKFNDTLNGKTMYPVVADPVGTELNQLWVSFSSIPDTLIRVGRQGMNLDNQRFVGTVGWRQNDQTYDAVMLQNTSIDGLTITASSVNKVNRIFGQDSAVGELDTETRLINASYKVSDSLKITGYGYFLDHDDILLGLSSKTYGLRVAGNAAINDDLKLVYEIEAAEQEDYKDNPTSYDASYFHIAPAIKGSNWLVGVGFESLEGDGTSSFKTPLATLHKFNGWADKFLVTPAGGLEDLYAKFVYNVKGQGNILDNTKIVVMYHEFDAEDSSTSADNYGDEIDIAISHPLNVSNIPLLKSGNILLKYADYNADDFATDTEKLWLEVSFKL